MQATLWLPRVWLSTWDQSYRVQPSGVITSSQAFLLQTSPQITPKNLGHLYSIMTNSWQRFANRQIWWSFRAIKLSPLHEKMMSSYSLVSCPVWTLPATTVSTDMLQWMRQKRNYPPCDSTKQLTGQGNIISIPCLGISGFGTNTFYMLNPGINHIKLLE